MDYKTSFSRYRTYARYIDPLARNKVVRAYFSIVASLLTVILLIVFAIRPTLVTITQLNKEIFDKRELSRKMDEKINEIELLRVQYTRIEPDLKYVFDAIPQSPLSLESAEISENVVTASKINLNTINDFNVSFNSTESALEALPVSISVSGDYFGIKHFINEFLFTKRLFTMNNLNIAASGKNNSGEALSVVLKGNYWFKK